MLAVGAMKLARAMEEALDSIEALDSVEMLDTVEQVLDNVEVMDSVEQTLDNVEPLDTDEAVDSVESLDSVEALDTIDVMPDSVEMVPDSVESLCPRCGTFHAGGVIGEACFQARRHTRRCARCGLLHEDYDLPAWKSLIVSSMLLMWRNFKWMVTQYCYLTTLSRSWTRYTI